MSIVRPRNRTVYFRISEEEFNRLMHLCENGAEARSISDLSRQAVQNLIENRENRKTNDGVAEIVLQLDRNLSELKLALRQLLQWVQDASPKRAGAPHAIRGIEEVDRGEVDAVQK
jgi:hypothetical protein